MQGLDKYAKTTKTIAMLQGEQVEQMLALKKQKSDNLAIQGFFNSNSRMAKLREVLGASFAKHGITEAVLANTGGLKTVGVAETITAKQNTGNREILNLVNQYDRGLIDLDTVIQEYYKSGARERDRVLELGKNRGFTSTAANSPFLQQTKFAFANVIDDFAKPYEEAIKSITENNTTKELLTTERNIEQDVNKIKLSTEYIKTGGSQAYLGITKPLAEATDKVAKLMTTFGNGLSTLNTKLGEMNDGTMKSILQFSMGGLVAGGGLAATYYKNQIGSWFTSFIENGLTGSDMNMLNTQSLKNNKIKIPKIKIPKSVKVGGTIASLLQSGMVGYDFATKGINNTYDEYVNNWDGWDFLNPSKISTVVGGKFGELSGAGVYHVFGDKGHILTPEEAKANWERVMGSSYQNINQPTYSEINKSKTVEAEEQKTQVTQSLNDSEILKEMKTTLNLIYDWLSRKYMNEIQTQTRFTPYNVNT